MKSLTNKIIAIVFAFLSFTNIKAQDDANCGFLVDGVIIDSLTSWALGEISVVFPIKQSWKKYDVIQGVAYADGFGMGRFQFKPADLEDYADSKYAVFNFFKKETTNESKQAYGTEYYCSDCKEGGDYPTKPNAYKRYEFYFILRGHNITSYVEYLDNYGSVVKEPRYGQGKKLDQWEELSRCGDLLYETKDIPYKVCFCSYDKSTYKKLMTDVEKKWKTGCYACNNCNECKIDFSKQAIQPGKKFILQIERVDFNEKFGKVRAGSTNTVVKTNTTETKTTVTKTTVTKTTTSGNTSAGALTASSLKPLDKSKAGYFVEKDGNQIISEGYKKGSARNGEVRLYDDGKLRSVITYLNDEKNGPAALYYSNGNLEESGNYKNDNKDGEWKRFTEAGKLAGTDIYVDGEKQ